MPPILLFLAVLYVAATQIASAQANSFVPESIIGRYELETYRKTKIPGIIPKSEIGVDDYYIEKGTALITKSSENRYSVSIRLYYRNNISEGFGSTVGYKGKLTQNTNVNNDGTVNSPDCSCAPCIGPTSGNYCVAFKKGDEAFNFTTLGSPTVSETPWVVFESDGQHFTTAIGGQTTWHKVFDIKHYHQIEKNPVFSNRTILSYGPEFSVCADGSESSIFKLTGKDIGTIRIKEDPNNDITQTATFGKFVVLNRTNDSLLVRYWHPTNLSLPESSSNKLLSIEITEASSSTVAATYSLRVYRAPVLMVHGIWSNGASFLPMESALGRYYSYTLLRRMDYQPTNNKSFAFNQPYVGDNINALLKQVRDAKVAAGKVDYIGHSMGGILGRLYLQSDSYRDNLHKLITLNTPHSGSQLGNFLISIPTVIRNVFCYEPLSRVLNKMGCNDGAVDDLRVDSEAILYQLNNNRKNERVVPSHAIGSAFVGNVTVGLGLALVEMSHILPFSSSKENWGDLFDGPNDYIVSLNSQLGGLPGLTATIIGGQSHIGSPANPEFISKVKSLLAADIGSGLFALSGFNPPIIPKPNTIGVNNDATASTITITSPQKGQVIFGSSFFKPVVSVKVSGSGLNEIRTLVTYDEKSLYLAKQPGSSFTSSFTSTGSGLGKKAIVAIGKTSTGETVVATSYFYLMGICGSIRSGEWSDPNTWACGNEPTSFDQVSINPGHTVTVSSNSAQAWRVYMNGGKLKYQSNTAKISINPDI